MAKAVKKEKGLFNKQDVLAVVWGVLSLYVGNWLIDILSGTSIEGFPEAGAITVFILLIALVTGFSGWVVTKKARNKAWYVSLLPLVVTFVLGMTLTAVVGAPYGFLDVYGGLSIVTLLMLLFSFLGGYAAKRFK